MNYYEIMSEYSVEKITSTTDLEIIKKVYRKAVLEVHPDKGGDPEKFKLLSEAYATLSDLEKKRRYDFELKSPKNVQDLFAQMFGGTTFYVNGIPVPASSFFRPKTENKIMHCIVPLSQFYTGELKVNVRRMILGSESVKEFKVPLRIFSDSKPCSTILYNEGDQYPGHNQGDLVFTFEIKNETEFTILGSDLLLKRKMSLYQALTECIITFTGLDSKEYSITIKEYLKKLGNYTIESQGLIRDTGERGRLLLLLELDIPVLTETQLQFIKKIEKN